MRGDEASEWRGELLGCPGVVLAAQQPAPWWLIPVARESERGGEGASKEATEGEGVGHVSRELEGGEGVRDVILAGTVASSVADNPRFPAS